MAESWCKVSSSLDSHPKVRRAGRSGREVFLFVLRRNAMDENPTPGRLSDLELDPDYLADQLMMSPAEAVTGVTACVTAGLLVQDEHSFVICGWTEGWGKKAKTNAERQAAFRARQQNHENPPVDVTKVTTKVTASVTRNGSNALDQSREDKRRVDEMGIPPSAPLARRKSPTSPLSIEWKPTPEHEQLARERGVDLELQARSFRAHAEANDRRCVRWNAAFTQWLLKAFPDRQSRANGPDAVMRIAQGIDP